jgi:hypothetical protein
MRNAIVKLWNFELVFLSEDFPKFYAVRIVKVLVYLKYWLQPDTAVFTEFWQLDQTYIIVNTKLGCLLQNVKDQLNQYGSELITFDRASWFLSKFDNVCYWLHLYL